MDYEKMYKAVLKTATQWIKDGCSDKEKICLECIFPELRESEDERILVRLIEYFQGFLEGYEDCYKDGGCVKWEGLDVKSILAWLEKQKETADSFTDGIIEVRSFQRGMEEGRKLERQKERKPVVTHGETYYVDTLGTQQMIAGKMPQKPVQSEEEKEYVRTLKGLVSDFIRDSGGGITDVEYYQNICDWLDGRHIEQKPAEWDDYTKTNLGRAIQIIKDARGTLHGYQTDDGIYECDKAIEALEHFLYRGLEIEKSAEWSEEDEEMLNSCICSIEESKENRYAYKETDGDTSYDHEIAWLKSLPERFNLQSKQEQNDYITPHKEFFKFIYDRLINVHKENPNVDYMRSFKERLNNLSFGEKQEWSEEDENMRDNILRVLGAFVGTVKCESNPSLSTSYPTYLREIDWLKSLRPSWKPSEEPEEPEYYQHFDPDC